MLNVLHVVAFQPVGGVGTFIINNLHYIDKSKVNFDILESDTNRSGLFNDKVQEMGSKLVLLPALKLKNILSYLSETNDFYKKNAKKYDVVHVHAPNLALVHLYFAKKYGINIRIIHAHNTAFSNSKIKSLRNKILIHLALKFATKLFAASKAAGNNYFGLRPFKVLPNGINIEKFKFNKKSRNEIRREFRIEDDKKIVGHVGTFIDSKNQDFILNIANRLSQYNFIFMLIGDGPKKVNIESKINRLGITNVILTGNRSDVEKLYSAMDIFVLPSLFEGFPLVGVEAQASGLPVLFSTKITTEIDICSNNYFLSIDERSSVAEWSKKIKLINLDRNVGNDNILRKFGYDSVSSAKKLINGYLS